VTQARQTWLVPADHRVPSPFSYGDLDPRTRPVELVVVHWTATPHSGAHQHGDDPARIRRWLGGSSRESSTHFAVTRAGEVIQGAPLEWRTWHAGGSRTADGRGDVNMRSIGIDLENVGNLSRGTGRWVDAYGGTYAGPAPHESPVALRDRGGVWERSTPDHQRVEGWEPYRVAQVAAFLAVARRLAHELPALGDVARWLGHCEVRATKLDPGPHFPWKTLGLVLAGRCEPGAVGDWHPTDRLLLVDG